MRRLGVLFLLILCAACAPADPYSAERLAQGRQTATAQYRVDLFAASDATQAAVNAHATATTGAQQAQQTAQAWQATTQADALSAALYQAQLQATQDALSVARVQVAATATGMSVQATMGAAATVRADEAAAARAATTARRENMLFGLAYAVCIVMAGIWCLGLVWLAQYGRGRARQDIERRRAETASGMVFEAGNSGQIIDLTAGRPRIISGPKPAGVLPSGLPQISSLPRLQAVEAEVTPDAFGLLEFLADAAEVSGWQSSTIPGWREMRRPDGSQYSGSVWSKFRGRLAERGMVDISSGVLTITGGRTLDDLYRLLPVDA